jgi:hypothetical protein
VHLVPGSTRDIEAAPSWDIQNLQAAQERSGIKMLALYFQGLPAHGQGLRKHHMGSVLNKTASAGIWGAMAFLFLFFSCF